MTQTIEKLGSLFIATGLVCLAAAGAFLVIGHDPENLVTNYQAEVAGNYAYGLIALGFICRLVETIFTGKKS